MIDTTKNLHISHIEDLIFQGWDAAYHPQHILVNLLDNFEGRNKHHNLSRKYDGAPAVVFGRHPENGKLFVGTKSVFNKRKPLINFTIDDIVNNHKDIGLQHKLASVLNHIQQIKNSVGNAIAYQAEFMFSKNSLGWLAQTGKAIFQPNTITYSPPDVHPTHNLGLIVHTEYHTNTTLSAAAAFPYQKTLDNTTSVWLKSAHIDTVLNPSEVEVNCLKALIEEVNESRNWLGDKILNCLSGYRNILEEYYNSSVRAGEHLLDPQDHFENFIKFTDDKLCKSIEYLLTNAAIGPALQSNQNTLGTLKGYKPYLIELFKLHDLISMAKELIMMHLEENADDGIHAYIDHGMGKADRISGEGFVYDCSGTPLKCKLVNRAEFSRINMVRQKQWQQKSENI